MSSPFAIAAVTAVMKNLIEEGLGNRGISGVSVSTRSPDHIDVGSNEPDRLNLFLYQVTPNQGWRNVGLPSHNSNGQQISNPPLGIDLHYLLTAYGSSDEFHAEILLGCAMQILHEHNILTRDRIQSEASTQLGSTTFIPSPPTVGDSDLVNQVELVKITPQAMGIEEMSKLWTSLQGHYRPSVAYHASVVLIESTRPAQSPLPVLSRGTADPVTGRDEGVIVQASLVPPYPTLEEAAPPNEQHAVRMGEELTLSGHDLDGDDATIRWTQLRMSLTNELPAMESSTATELHVQLPSDPLVDPALEDTAFDPASWAAGIYSVVAVIASDGESRISNTIAVALAPTILTKEAAIDGQNVVVTIECSPMIRNGQSVALIVGSNEIPCDEFDSDETDTVSFTAPRSSITPGTNSIRLRVDGVESILIDRSVTPPVFHDSEKVTIP